MTKSFFKLDGVVKLKKQDQLKINGGNNCRDTYIECSTVFSGEDVQTCMHVWLCGHYVHKAPIVAID